MSERSAVKDRASAERLSFASPWSDSAVKISRKLLAILFGVMAVTATVSASIIASFVVPSSVNVTAQPGIEVDNYPAGGRVTSLAFGDVQTGQVGSMQIIIVNTGGSTVFIILGQSMSANPALPSGIVLSWDLASASQLNPGQSTVPILVKLSVSATATPGPLSWTTTFNA